VENFRRGNPTYPAATQSGGSSIDAMSRGYVVFGDIEGKLDVLRVECAGLPAWGMPPCLTP
jgi:hypothetical protein